MTKPDVAVVLVDADGEASRYKNLRKILDGRRDPQPRAIAGVATEEFEAWLVADEAALRKHLGFAGDPLPGAESLPPGHAKNIVTGLIAQKFAGIDVQKAALVELVHALNLATVANVCTSFSRFRSELHAIGKAR